MVFDLYSSFSYLSESQKLNDAEKNIFKEIVSDKNFICNIRNKDKVTDSLSNLLKFLYKHHGIKPILLIDEYDVPIAKAAHYNYYEEMIDIISPFLDNALKTNLYLGRAVLTGCLRAAKESIFTGLNNLLVCSVLDSGDDDISRGVRFTGEESEEVLSYYGVSDYYKEVRNNYDGYHFGEIHMYCPWDVMSFCYANYRKVGVENKTITADNYWINTSGNDVIEEFMGFTEPEDVDKMQDLLDGKSITTEVRTSLCYGDLKEHDITDFWTLLLYTGYLTFDPQSHSPENDSYSLYIPNEEIRKCFKSKILNFLKNNSVMKNNTGKLVKGLFEGDAETVENSLNGLLAKYVSIRDFSVNAPKENYYHGFMNGLLVNGTSYMEEHKSNTEAGDGYADIIASSKNDDTIVIMELKQTARPFGAKFSVAVNALEQVLEKRYADEFVKDSGIKNVYAYGICFYKKSCSVQVKKLK